MKNNFKSDVFYMGLVQIINYAIPLLIFPYLTRILGLTGFGEYSYTLALLLYPLMIVNFGFDLSATVTIVQLKENKDKLVSYISSIYVIKLSLTLLIIFLLTLIYLAGFFEKQQWILIAATIPALIGATITSTYIFQAFGLLKQLSIITMFSRLLSVPLTFIYVSSSEDVTYALLIYSLPFFITGVISIIYLIKVKVLYDFKINSLAIKDALFDGYVMFKSSVATSVYFNAIPLFIGLLHSVEMVGMYNVANTIRNVAINIINVYFRAQFPWLSRMYSTGEIAKANILVKKAFYFITALVSCCVLFSFFVSDYIILIFSGNSYSDATILLDVLSVSIILSVINNFYGLQTLVVNGLKVSFSSAVTRGAILSFMIILPSVYFYSALGGAISVVVSEIIIFYFLRLEHKKNKLNILI